jgi:hypothetical protein
MLRGTGHVTLIQSPLSLLLTCLRPHIYVVSSTPIYANIAIRLVHDLSTVLALGPRDFLLGNKRDVESGCGRSHWMCSRSRRVVLARRLAKRDAWRILDID